MKFIMDYFREVEEAFLPLTKYKLFLLGSLIASLDCMMYVIIISFIFILEYLFGDIGSKIAYGTIDILAVATFIILIRMCSKSLKYIIKRYVVFFLISI